MRNISRKIRKMTTDLLDLPQDVAFDLPRITMIGNLQLYIENHRGILGFSNEILNLKINLGELAVHGEQLVIRTIRTEEIFIEGVIHRIQYIQRG